MNVKRWFQWTWVVVGVLFLAAGVYYYLTIQSLQEELAHTEEQLTLTRDQLRMQIQQVDSLLSEQITSLDSEVEEFYLELQQGLIEQESARKLEIAGLQGKISEVEEVSKLGIEQLQEDVKNINIKSQDFTEIIDEVLDATVSVFTNSGLGSGVIVDGDGYVVTNYHVIAGITSGGIQTYDKKVYSMRIVAYDADHDLALVQMQTSKEQTYLRFADSDEVKVGTKVIASGNPVGLEFTITEGIVSAVGRVDGNGVPVVQTDVPINPGNSGGPLINIQREIVGINTYKAQGYEGLGFAIEADTVKDFVDDAIAADQE